MELKFTFRNTIIENISRAIQTRFIVIAQRVYYLDFLVTEEGTGRNAYFIKLF